MAQSKQVYEKENIENVEAKISYEVRILLGAFALLIKGDSKFFDLIDKDTQKYLESNKEEVLRITRWYTEPGATGILSDTRTPGYLFAIHMLAAAVNRQGRLTIEFQDNQLRVLYIRQPFEDTADIRGDEL